MADIVAAPAGGNGGLPQVPAGRGEPRHRPPRQPPATPGPDIPAADPHCADAARLATTIGAL